ncbi:MAG: hypothetical protein VX247_09185, partial [Pseudomonadota bacterium]|nr:hypothetical protein [Pseudomonadota bacterium]
YSVTKGVDEPLLIKIVRVTPLAHFWLFALGALCYLHLERIMGALSHLGRGPLGWAIPLAAYTGFAVLLAPSLTEWVADAIGFVILASAILCAGLVAPSAAKVLGGNDISYGLYLYHMLVVNMLLELRITGATGVMATLVISIALATLSWRYIESVVLHRKKRALTPADRFPA